jgi:hypothetical protein
MTSTLPLWLAAGLYLWQALEFAKTGQIGMVTVFLCYAGANFGFIWAAK